VVSSLATRARSALSAAFNNVVKGAEISGVFLMFAPLYREVFFSGSDNFIYHQLR
jgi:hypothetical protein